MLRSSCWLYIVMQPRVRLALVTFMNMRPYRCLVMVGIVCSSFVGIAAGTHRRCPTGPLGDTSVKGVAAGNLFMSRTAMGHGHD